MGSSGSKGKGLDCPSSSNTFSAKVRRVRPRPSGFNPLAFLLALDLTMATTTIVIEADEWNQATLTDVDTRTGSPPAQASSTQSLNLSSRSCFRFITGSLSFRLTRALSLGSSSLYPVSSSSLPVLYNEDELHLRAERVRASINRDETQEDNDELLSSQLDGTQTSCNGNHTDDFRLTTRAFDISDCPPYDETTTLARDRETNIGYTEVRAHEQRTCVDNTQVRTGINICSPIISNGSEIAESRIVLLAEALFEVLDEIRQQSRVLSSRPSASSIGSTAAPTEIVDSLPVKSYSKWQNITTRRLLCKH